jgi:hypothetical protein
MTDKRKAYEEKLAAQLQEWNAQLALLKAKAENAKANLKVEYFTTLEVLQRKRDEGNVKLQELKKAGDGAWEEIKNGMEKSWTEIKTSFHEAVSKFK